jgi:hypothetical protein
MAASELERQTAKSSGSVEVDFTLEAPKPKQLTCLKCNLTRDQDSVIWFSVMGSCCTQNGVFVFCYQCFFRVLMIDVDGIQLACEHASKFKHQSDFGDVYPPEMATIRAPVSHEQFNAS